MAKRVMTTIDRVPAIDSYSDEGLKIADFQGHIEFQNVTFAYPKRSEEPVFRSLNLVCKAGKRTALVGGSGSGKSTIIALVERFYDVSSGAVLVDGTDIRNCPRYGFEADGTRGAGACSIWYWDPRHNP